MSFPREVVVEAVKGHVTPFRKRVESRVALLYKRMRLLLFFREVELMRQTRADNMSAAAAAAGQNGHTNNTAASEFKSSNNLWSDFFGAADQVGF